MSKGMFQNSRSFYLSLFQMKYSLFAVTLAVMLIALPGRVNAQQQGVPTQVMIRAVSQDAKVLQDPVGGARIFVRDTATGDTLAQGLQTGSSGSTDFIMRQPRERGAVVYDTPGTAGYLATLTLERPTVVEIVAEGPLAYPQAIQRAAKTMLLIPGQDVLGDGVILTIHGFIVDIVSPDKQAVRPGDNLEVRATTVMTCGCPTEPGGLWDSDEIDIVARLVREGRVVAEAPLLYAGERSTYAASIQVPAGAAGRLSLEVLAMDPENVNFGRDTLDLTLLGFSVSGGSNE